jgi:hypothetical protein
LYKRLRSRITAILTAALIMISLMGTQVFASSALKVSSSSVMPSDSISVQVTGITQAQMDAGAWIGFFLEGARNNQYLEFSYISELPATNVYKITAPKEYGKYEFRLFLDQEEVTVAAVSEKITIGAKQASFQADKTKLEPGKTIKVKVGEIPETEEFDGAWIGLYKDDAKNHQYIEFSYIKELPANNTWEVAVPKELGKYHFRAFNDEEYKLALGTGGAFEIVQYQSKLTLGKTSFAANEEIAVQFSDESIFEDAWIGVYKADSKDENYLSFAYLRDLTKNTYKVKVAESGSFNFRIFLDSQYVKTGTSPTFTVHKDGTKADDATEGYDVTGASEWAVTEISDAVDLSLVTENVMSEFQQDITREEFCELAVKLYEKMSGKTASPAAVNPFTDTGSKEILKAYELGIVKGISEKEFAPKYKVTRQEISVMLFRTLKLIMPNMNTEVKQPGLLLDKEDVASWAAEAVGFFHDQGIIKGNDGSITDAAGVKHEGVYILPKANTTREQSIALVKRIYEKYFGI